MGDDEVGDEDDEDDEHLLPPAAQADALHRTLPSLPSSSSTPPVRLK